MDLLLCCCRRRRRRRRSTFLHVLIVSRNHLSKEMTRKIFRGTGFKDIVYQEVVRFRGVG